MILLGYTPPSLSPGELFKKLTGEELPDENWENSDFYYGFQSSMCDNTIITVRCDTEGVPLVGIAFQEKSGVLVSVDLPQILKILEKVADAISLPKEERQTRLLTT